MRSILGRALEMTKHREILLILPPKHVSLETVRTSERVIKSLSPEMQKRITVYRTMFVSTPGSDDVATAFEMAADGRGVTEIVSKLESRRNDVCFLACLNSVEPLIQSDRMKNNFSAKMQRKMETKLLGYMPLPFEAEKYSETKLLRKHFGEGATTVVKIDTAKSWEKLMEKAFIHTEKSLHARGIDRGTMIDVFVTTPGNPHRVTSLLCDLYTHYKVRFFDFACMAPALLGSAWYPSCHIYIRRVVPDDISYGRRGATQRPDDCMPLRRFEKPEEPPLGV